MRSHLFVAEVRDFWHAGVMDNLTSYTVITSVLPSVVEDGG